VASIAEAHGGQATVRTAVGKGSTFAVAIPLAAPPPEG
jgi:signal transduction histidine kinase